jgi:TolA-binding protein
MTRSTVALFCAIQLVICLQVYWGVREYVNPAPRLREQVAQLKAEIDRKDLGLMVRDQNLENFKAHVAATLPPSFEKIAAKAKDYPVRNLASISRKGSREKLDDLIAETLFETGKNLFRQKEYIRASRLFEKVINNHGYASQVPEALFLLSEAQYQLGQVEASSATIGRMMDLFPESELTGFALLRLGRIFEERDRYDEAVQIYRTVLKGFPYRTVATQAERSLREMEP